MTQALPEFLKTVTIPEDDLEFGKEITVTHTEVVPVSADVYWSGFDDYFYLQENVGMHKNMTTVKVSSPAHAREIRRVLVASMDFRAPRVRPRIFPYTPGFVLAVHVHGNLRPAHLACVGERLTIRGQHRNEPANRQEEGLSESSEKKERKATAVTQKRLQARLEANRQTAHPGSDLKARAPTTQAGPAALPPGVHPAPSTPLRPDCDHNRHQHHAIPQTDMGQFVLPG
ncbi:hypothetical protein Bbelb_415750 [Branchiostoma belcheri]|nr:hypothetical protein Bbelb_415750 [Branchiostoma belcheri]